MELEIPHVKLHLTDETIKNILIWCKKEKSEICIEVFGGHK